MNVSERLQQLLHRSTRVAVLTGAGVSAESGVPTFRAPDGLWSKFRPEELATFAAFRQNPRLVWEWYNYRRKLMHEVSPNPGHESLVAWERFFDDFALITQNVDGLHRRAGSMNIFELHGNIQKNKCADCDRPLELADAVDPDDLPRCSCGGMVRPDVVWYGEMLLAQVVENAWAKTRACDLFFSVGTSAVVQPAASLPLVARENGAYVVEVNPENTPITPYCHEVFSGPSGEILPQLTHYLKHE